MIYRVHLKSELAKVGGLVVRLYRAYVDQRENDWTHWEPCDQSLLFDSALDCQREAEELRGLYEERGVSV